MVFYIWAKSKVIENLFSYISGYADFLPITLFLLLIFKLHSEKGLWIIVSYCVASVLGDLIVTSLDDPSNKVNLYYNSFWTLFEYLAFTAFLYISIKKKTVRRIMLILSVLFIAFQVIYFFNSKHSRIDSIPVGIETMLILGYSFYLLFEMTNTIKDTFINYNYRFWIVLGMMIYLSGSFFIYLYANQLAPGEGRKYGILIDFFYILKNIFFAVAIIMCYRQPKPKLPPSSIPFLDLDTPK